MRPLSAPSSGQLPAAKPRLDQICPLGPDQLAAPPPAASTARARPAAKRLVPLLAMSDITPTFRRERPKTLATPKFLLGKRLGHHNPLLALATVDRRTAGRS